MAATESPKPRPTKTSLFCIANKPILHYKQAYFTMQTSLFCNAGQKDWLSVDLSGSAENGNRQRAYWTPLLLRTCFRLANDVYYTAKCLTLACQVTCLRWTSTAFTSRKWVTQQNNAPQKSKCFRRVQKATESFDFHPVVEDIRNCKAVIADCRQSCGMMLFRRQK